MNRDEYIEHLRARLKAAEEVIHKSTKQDPVGWQFLENGEWHQGGLFNNHRRNTEEAGYPVRDVYAGPVMSAETTPHEPQCNVLHPAEETGVCDCKLKASAVVMPDALSRAFITCESVSDSYRVVIKSKTLEETQSIHNWIVRLNAADQEGDV